jgi:hypothetical protein
MIMTRQHDVDGLKAAGRLRPAMQSVLSLLKLLRIVQQWYVHAVLLQVRILMLM